MLPPFAGLTNQFCAASVSCYSFASQSDPKLLREANMKTKSRARAPVNSARRQFTKAVATALAAAPLAVATIKAQTPPATKEPAAPPNPQPSPTPQPPSPLAVAYGEVARVRFGDKLTADELTRVKRNVAGKVNRGDALRAAKLTNSDEPDFVFSA